MRMPGLKSGKIENPFMFTFPPEEPTISKVEFIDQVPRYDAVRLAQSLVKKGTVCTGSLSQFNWQDLGLQVGMCYRSLPPNVSFLYRPLNAKYTPKEREKVQRCKKVQEEEEEEQPEDGASKIEQQGEESLDVKGTLHMAIS
jgi:hypothetical protein